MHDTPRNNQECSLSEEFHEGRHQWLPIEFSNGVAAEEEQYEEAEGNEVVGRSAFF